MLRRLLSGPGIGLAIGLLLLFGLLAVGHTGGAQSNSSGPAASVQPAAAVAPMRFYPAKLTVMKRRFLAESPFVDLLQGDSRYEVDWQLGVVGERHDGIDLARIACRELREAGLVDDDTDVRIVNVLALEQNVGDFRGASLGHVECRHGESVGV